jgi:hypothetical protein
MPLRTELQLIDDREIVDGKIILLLQYVALREPVEVLDTDRRAAARRDSATVDWVVIAQVAPVNPDA